MKPSQTQSIAALPFTRLDRIVLHVRCLWRDHKVAWHLAGIWREVSFQ